MALLIFCVLLFVLFLLSRSLTRLLSRLFMHVFHSQVTSIHALSFLFLPGVVLHELSHLLLANILFVPTGQVEFFPEIHGSEVKMGSVAIAKTDPLRRFLIGIAPVIGGLGIFLLAFSYLQTSVLGWQTIVLGYIVFQVGNTMFSSSKDMEGAVGFVVGAILIGIVLQFLGLPVVLWVTGALLSPYVLNLFGNINVYLLLALGLDIFLVLLFEGLTRLRSH